MNRRSLLSLLFALLARPIAARVEAAPSPRAEVPAAGDHHVEIREDLDKRFQDFDEFLGAGSDTLKPYRRHVKTSRIKIDPAKGTITILSGRP